MAILMLLLSVPAFASDDEYAEQVLIRGVDVTSGGYWRVNSKEEVVSASSINYSIAYNRSERKLTLKNTEFTSMFTESRMSASGIFTTRELNIELIGENTIECRHHGYDMTAGIWSVNGDINITGGGSLTIICEYSSSDEISYGILSNDSINIKNTSVRITDNGKTQVGAFGIQGSEVNIENAKVDIDFNKQKYSIGIFEPQTGSALNVVNSELNISMTDCKNIYGIQIYSISFDNSRVNINIDANQKIETVDDLKFGIFAYTFVSDKSYVNVAVNAFEKPSGSIAFMYNNYMINGSSNYPISKTAKWLNITPDGLSASASNVFSSGISLYGGLNAGGYYRIKDGAPVAGNFENVEDWNIHYDCFTNTLILRNANLSNMTTIDGFVNIRLEGDNTMSSEAAVALIVAYAPTFSGTGTLTLVSQSSCALATRDLAPDGTTVITASLNSDGSNAVSFDNEDMFNYKWIKIDANEPEPEPEKELSFFQKIIKFFSDLFNSIISLFKF